MHKNRASRRTILKGAAWAMPVIAAAVTAPVAAATSVPATEPAVCGGTGGNNGRYYVEDDRITVAFDAAPDIYEINVRYVDGSAQSFGTNYGSAPARGETAWAVPLRARPAWIQVHGFNDHYGIEC
ncbi:hypothetical protein [Microbacterium sp. No. 7]|uniref:hypothetical protein n=1 Tax=Microbacterium sp. No. 7 TaxID=1714373 RepID=UPI0006D021F3|nr:hypothetical protein [Microbacterium sp. No. 7]ALJ22073.1 hypothetical protein AOA12_20140 [Microbacterium sp. No. 7]